MPQPPLTQVADPTPPIDLTQDFLCAESRGEHFNPYLFHITHLLASAMPQQDNPGADFTNRLKSVLGLKSNTK